MNMEIPELGKDRAYLVIQWPEEHRFLSLAQIKKKFRAEFKYSERVQIKKLQFIGKIFYA